MSQRACSFCKVSGHTINQCQDPVALELIRTAEFKCRIAIQYLGTDAEQQMFKEIYSWFRQKSISKLKVLLFAKWLRPPSGKARLVARAIWAYYFNNWINPELPLLVVRRFVCRGRYHGNIANGMDAAEASRILDQDLFELRLDPESAPRPTAPEKIPIIDGLTEESVDCPICFETESDIAQTNCGHLFCRPCIMQHTKGIIAACPCCRTAIDLFIIK
jgi:hypothetical protein